MPTRPKRSVADTIIDFAKEESGGGGGIRIKEGTYRAKIIKAVPTVSTEKGTDGLQVVFQILEGKYKGKKITDNLWVAPKAFSRFRVLLEACDAEVPKKIKLSSIAAAVKGATLYIEVQDEEREGYKTRSRVTFEGFISEDDYDPDVDDDAEDDDEVEDLDDEDEEEEEGNADELDEMDRAELKAYIKEQELEVTVRKSMSDDDLREAIKEAQGEDEEEEEEEEEEPEPPKRRRRKRAPVEDDEEDEAPPKRRSRSRKKKTQDEDLDELDLDDL